MSTKKKSSLSKTKSSNTKSLAVKASQPIPSIKLETKKEIDHQKTVDVKPTKKPLGRKGTQYLFNGETYGKGKLVLAIIKSQVSKFPKSTLNDLQKMFPKEIQGYYSIVESLPIAKKKSENYARYFLGENQPIKLADGTTIAVTTQWGSSNIEPFLAIARKQGYSIKETK